MLLLNTGGLFLVSVALLILAILLFKKWQYHTVWMKKKTKAIICSVSYVMLIIVIGSIMLGDLQKYSTVDVSPVIALETLDFDNPDGIVSKLQFVQDQLGNQFEVLDSPGAVTGCTYYPEDSIDIEVSVIVMLYENPDLAKEDFEKYRSRHSEGTAYKYEMPSDNIETLLFNSSVNRADGLGWLAITDRHVRTLVRVKSMTIAISEIRYDGGTIGQVSNKAIEELYEAIVN